MMEIQTKPEVGTHVLAYIGENGVALQEVHGGAGIDTRKLHEAWKRVASNGRFHVTSASGCTFSEAYRVERGPAPIVAVLYHRALVAPRPEEFEGFTNFETFTIYTQIAHDRKEAAYWRRRVLWHQKRAADAAHPDWTEEENARFGLEDELRGEWEHRCMVRVEEVPGPLASLVSHTLNRVDWREIARKLISDAQEFGP